MTWKQLAQKIAELSPERQEDTATVCNYGEGQYWGIQDFLITDETDVLDEGHAFATFNE